MTSINIIFLVGTLAMQETHAKFPESKSIYSGHHDMSAIAFGGIINTLMTNIPGNDSEAVRITKLAVDHARNAHPSSIPAAYYGLSLIIERTSKLKLIYTVDDRHPVLLQVLDPATGEPSVVPIVWGVMFYLLFHLMGDCSSSTHSATVLEYADGETHILEHIFHRKEAFDRRTAGEKVAMFWFSRDDAQGSHASEVPLMDFREDRGAFPRMSRADCSESAGRGKASVQGTEQETDLDRLSGFKSPEDEAEESLKCSPSIPEYSNRCTFNALSQKRDMEVDSTITEHTSQLETSALDGGESNCLTSRAFCCKSCCVCALTGRGKHSGVCHARTLSDTFCLRHCTIGGNHYRLVTGGHSVLPEGSTTSSRHSPVHSKEGAEALQPAKDHSSGLRRQPGEPPPSIKSSGKPQSGVVPFRLLSYNVWNTNVVDGGDNAYRERITHLAKLCLQSGADVIAFQEVRFEDGKGGSLGPNQLLHLSSLLPDYQFIYQPAQIQHTGIPYMVIEGVAIFSKYPIMERKHLLLTRNANDVADGHQRVLLHAVIEVPGVGKVHVLNTHLSLSHEARLTSVGEIWNYIQRLAGPVFLAGDFNAEGHNDEVRFLAGQTTVNGQRTRGLYDMWSLLNSDPKNAGYTFNTLENQLSKRIDFIFVREATVVDPLKVTLLDDGKRGKTAASDHLGLVATFALAPAS